MLKLPSEGFLTGRAKFQDHAPGRTEPTAKIFVRILLPGMDSPRLALLDTGAAWSVLDTETADVVEILEELEDAVPLSTRRGDHRGRLVRAMVKLIAEEGESLDVEATFFISKDWPSGEIFLGYSGLLERIRFAVDPPLNHFYFGDPGNSDL